MKSRGQPQKKSKDSEKSVKVANLINAADCIVSIEVIAEAVYNLGKYYDHSRQLIADEIKDFIGIKKNFCFRRKCYSL
jgi:predicted nucleic acid-binding protein